MGDFLIISCLNCTQISQNQAWWPPICFAWMKPMYFLEYFWRFSRKWHHFCFFVVTHLNQIRFRSSIFQPVWPWNLMTQKNNRATLLCYFKVFASFRSHWWIQTGVKVRKRLIWVKIDAFFQPCDLKIWGTTFKNSRAPLQCYFKHCAAFRSHWWIQTRVTAWKRPIWVKCYNF